MESNKKGFSLAEVLIALTVAAIIATFGFSIAKKGIAKAYDRYIYAGYYAISTVLSDVEDTRGLTMRDQGCLGSLSDRVNCVFSNRVIAALNGRNVGVRDNRRDVLNFDTPNGINYHIARIGTHQYPQYGTLPQADDAFLYQVRMRVPAAKRGRATQRTICMLYVENFLWDASGAGKNYENLLMPYDPGYPDVCQASKEAPFLADDRGNRVDIQSSKHILPFYLDDGKRGQMTLRDNPNQNPSEAQMNAWRQNPDNYEYNQRIFRTAKDAYCLKSASGNDGREILGLNNRLDCNGNAPANAQSWEREATSIIRVTDPRRI